MVRSFRLPGALVLLLGIAVGSADISAAAPASAAARCSGAPGSAPCERLYGPNSPFNRGVPARPRLLGNSAGIVRQMLSWGPAHRPVIGHSGTSEDYSHPVYYATKRSPVFRVRCAQWTSSCEVHGKRVRIPDRALPAAGDDGHLAVVDRRSGWEYDFWQVRSKPRGGGTLVVSHGGRTRVNGSGLGSQATAAGFGLAAGIVRPHELRKGLIRHALFMTVKCSSGRAVYPADRRSSGSACGRFGENQGSAPPLGAHMWLNLSPGRIAALGVPRWKRTILHALHRYGAFIGDTMNGNSSFGISFESGQSYTSFGLPDPWHAIGRRAGGGSYSGGYVLNLDAGGWTRHLQVLDPCVSRGRC